ncbi:hypothetical protein [uncultured Mucilaginibacter sp.]|uniref:hypothetical protein n=1 Tax=uncultured Mucilaginibacter sp. TaxID=797541 RepID=UPI0025CEC16E|nr:hypothetical protein [uncultured Mucilaginibacter sp.]
MKTIAKFGLLILLAGSLFTSCTVQGGFVVRERPVEPVYERPVAPYGDAIWIGGEWEWRGGNYVYIRGHYEHRREGHEWIPGHWNNTPRGYSWERGHWS